MSTKERILDAALQLFNTEGVAAISTNHIAAAATMSPGNLYYHYRNKEAIICALVEREFQAYDQVWTLPADHAPTLDDLRAMLTRHFALLWAYRFFHRELVALLHGDAALHLRYRTIQQQRRVEIRRLLTAYVDAGVLRADVDDHVLDDVVTTGWLISDFWLSYLEAFGVTPDAAAMEHGVRLSLRLFEPYLAPAAAA